MDNLIKTLKSNPDLLKQVAKLWTDGASNEEIAEAFAAKGIQVEQAQIEQLLVMLQKERSKTIGKRILDEDLLEVSGGKDCWGGCVNYYYVEDCMSTVKEDSWCMSNDACVWLDNEYTMPGSCVLFN